MNFTQKTAESLIFFRNHCGDIVAQRSTLLVFFYFIFLISPSLAGPKNKRYFCNDIQLVADNDVCTFFSSFYILTWHFFPCLSLDWEPNLYLRHRKADLLFAYLGIEKLQRQLYDFTTQPDGETGGQPAHETAMTSDKRAERQIDGLAGSYITKTIIVMANIWTINTDAGL